VTIVGLLASIALPLSELATKRNNEQELRHALREIREALDAYRRASDEGRIPARSNSPATRRRSPRSLTGDRREERVGVETAFPPARSRDPLSANGSVSAESTWGLRSYESPIEAPRPGRDVFDVYSTSEGAGLNGVPYKEW